MDLSFACKLAFVWILSVSIDNCAGLFNPYREGPFERKTVIVGNGHAEDLHFELRVSAPVADGAFPVLYFLGGFHMNVPNFVYDELLDRLASFGIIAVAMWRFTIFTDEETTTQRIRRVISYAEEELAAELKQEACPFDFFCPDEWVQFPANFSISTDGFYMAGHSSGGPDVVRLPLEDDGSAAEKVKGLILMSPVDGGDPWGLTGEFITPEEGTLPLNMPSLIIMAGLDAVPGQDLPFYPACAPEGMSNTRFYNAFNPPKWFINATEFGHADVTSEFFADIVAFTGICESGDPSLNRMTYRDFVVGQTAAFISAIENPEKNCDMLIYLEDLDMMLEENVVAFYDRGGDSTSCPF